MKMRVTVIGAGAAGLTAIKCCLDEQLEPVCFERTSYIGGLWHFTRDEVTDTARVMAETVTNTSKEVCSFSDFPPPKEFPIFMHNSLMDRYLNMYADNFNLRPYVRLNNEVLEVKESIDHETTGQWTVTVRDLKSGSTETRTFDAVIVCSGAFRKPKRPRFEGDELFRGRIIDANQYLDSDKFKGKRVVVVGLGNTAVDIATDLCSSVSQVYLSSRSGGWLFSRIGENGAPLDFGISRFLSFIVELIPNFIDKVLTKRLNAKLDHAAYGLFPTDTPLRSNIVVSDFLPPRLITGEIKMKPGIARFHVNSIDFTDGSDVSDIDYVIMATGYTPVYPFLDSSVIGDDKTRLYKAVFPPDITHHTLAILSCIRLRGPVPPIAEMQARFATRVFKGLVKLPDKEEMLESIANRNAVNKAKRNPNMLDVIQIDYFPYMDELGEMIGCRPNLLKLFFTDRQLAKKCIFGPLHPYQFRLHGPGAWDGARETLLTAEFRTYYPLGGRRKSKQTSSGSWLFILTVSVLVMVYFILL